MLKFISLLTLGLLLTACQARVESSPIAKNKLIETNESLDSIVNGREVSNESFESKLAVFVFVELPNGMSEVCTGALIADEYILSAGHCLDEKAIGYHALFNTNFADLKENEIIELDQITRHPEYKPLGVDPAERNDIVIFHLQKPAPKEYQRLRLPEDTKDNKVGYPILALGFGEAFSVPLGEVAPPDFDNGEGRLRQIHLKTEEFRRDHPYFVVPQKSGGACAGDSGGPAIRSTSTGVEVLGLVSSKEYTMADKNRCLTPTYYTNVAYHLTWIKEVINANQNQLDIK